MHPRSLHFDAMRSLCANEDKFVSGLSLHTHFALDIIGQLSLTIENLNEE